MVLSPQDFDRLLEALRAALTKDPSTGFVFSCLNGQGRTTTAMVVAVLVCWHIGVGVTFSVKSEVIPGRSGYGECKGSEVMLDTILGPLPSVLSDPQQV